MLISHFPKPKDASYFLIIADKSHNDILAIKRVSMNRFTSKEMTIVLPDDIQNGKLDIYLMCDSYIGLDQCHKIDIIAVNNNLDLSKQGPNYISYRSLQQEAITQDANDGIR